MNKIIIILLGTFLVVGGLTAQEKKAYTKEDVIEAYKYGLKKGLSQKFEACNMKDI